MTDATTTHYGWAYPTVNADADSWGATLNTAIIAIDAQTFANADAALQKSANLSDLANAATARTNLGLGTAATEASGTFDAAGAAGAAQAASLEKASNLSDLANAATARANLGLGSAATQNTSAFDASGAAASAQSASCQKSANLGDVASASSARANLGLGSIAVNNITVSSSAPSGTPNTGDLWCVV